MGTTISVLPLILSWNRMQRMRKKSLVALAVLSAIVLAFILWLFLVPFVIYVQPQVPEEYGRRLTHPVTTPFYLVGKDGGLLSRFRSPDLVVYSPISERMESDAITLEWGNPHSDEDYSLTFNKIDMYRSALSETEGRAIAFLYDRNDWEAQEIFSSLEKEYPSLLPVSYDGRVSVVNEEDILSSLDKVWGVIVFDSESSAVAWRKTKAKVIMDTVSAASALTLDKVMAIEPRWDEIIPSALKKDSLSFHYTLTVI